MVKTKGVGFVKMEACGNDCILFDTTQAKIQNPNRLAKKVCDRRYGIGADQMLVLSKSRKADFKMEIYNADGSVAEMCGNGIRCLARYVHDTGLTSKKLFEIETLAGIRQVKLHSKTVEVDMGEPQLKGKEIPVNLSGRIINRPLKIDTKDLRITCLSMGNPHCILFQENVDTFPVEKYGPLLEHYHLFPKRVNVSFVNVMANNELKLRVWERGVGETLACGTAACASLVASVLNGFTERTAKISMPGGKVEVEWKRDSNHVWLAGPAELVCSGQITL